MEWPEPKQVQDLMDAGGISGAEYDVLNEFLALPVADWQYYADMEGRNDPEVDESDVDTEADNYGERFPTLSMVRRVNQILQNHR